MPDDSSLPTLELTCCGLVELRAASDERWHPMTTTHTAPPHTTDYATEEAGRGWLVFASVTLGIAGIMRVFDAIWAWRYNGPVPENLQKAIFGRDLDTYGWVYIVVAAVLILSAVAVLHG